METQNSINNKIAEPIVLIDKALLLIASLSQPKAALYEITYTREYICQIEQYISKNIALKLHKIINNIEECKFPNNKQL